MNRWDRRRNAAQQVTIDMQRNLSRLSDEPKIARVNKQKHLEQLRSFRNAEYVQLMLQYHDLKDRVDVIERKLNIQPLTKIEEQVKKLLSQISIIENIYINPNQPSFLLITVQRSTTVYSAITQIQPEIAKLNNKFSNMFFEPWILHSDTVREEDLQQLKLILKR